MRSSTLLGQALAALALMGTVSASPVAERGMKKVKPKVFIIDMFPPEAEAWYDIPEFDLLEKNITVAGFSPIFPDAHCTANGEVCQLVTGESEINAAASISALTLSPLFDLTKTYFLIAGIAGINPKVATLSSVTFARFAVQVALQYEFDTRDIPSNLSTGYVPFGVTSPSDYPTILYGTEVFEVNDALKDIAIKFASTAVLNDSADAIAYRANYASSSEYAAAAAAPSVVACDVATSDVYYSGTLLSEAFENTTTLFTNGTGNYCSTAQEDNATLEAILRATLANLTDYSRVIVMRTASDFDRPYPGEGALENLFYSNQGGFLPAVENIYLAGIKVVMGILDEWDSTFKKGIKPTNYIGDIFGSLGGTPDFGPGNLEAGAPTKRDLLQRKRESYGMGRRLEGRRMGRPMMG